MCCCRDETRRKGYFFLPLEMGRVGNFIVPWLVARSTRHSNNAHQRQDDDAHAEYGWPRTTLKLALFSSGNLVWIALGRNLTCRTSDVMIGLEQHRVLVQSPSLGQSVEVACTDYCERNTRVKKETSPLALQVWSHKHGNEFALCRRTARREVGRRDWVCGLCTNDDEGSHLVSTLGDFKLSQLLGHMDKINRRRLDEVFRQPGTPCRCPNRITFAKYSFCFEEFILSLLSVLSLAVSWKKARPRR